MRVLHINSTIVINSGVMSVLMNYYRNIDRRQVQFDFLYFSVPNFNYNTYENEIKRLGGNVFLIENLKNIISFNKRLSRILMQEKYLTVHIHDPFIIRFIYNTLRNNGVKNIIVHSHATKWSDKTLNGIRNKMLCINLEKRADYFFACSHAAGDFLYGNSSPYYVMNNAIDLEHYQYNDFTRKTVRSDLGIEDDELLFGHVGNICLQKNHSFLIDVFKEIKDNCPKSTLLLIGDGVLRNEIERRVKYYGLERKVLFLGKKINVEDYYQAMDCLILPSLYEGLPMVGVEAQCSGLPILFSDTITREVGAEFSNYLSLKDSKKRWAQEAIRLSKQKLNRLRGKTTMASLGFDIHIEALKLQNEYLKIEKD